MNTVTIKGTIKVPTVTEENLASDKSIRDAINNDTLATLKAGEAGIRSYGFLASVVALTEYKAKELVDTYGADKGRLSKAGKCVAIVVNDIISPETASYVDYAEAIEYLVANFSSLNEAYDSLSGKVKKDPTLADIVSGAIKTASKYGYSVADILAEIDRQVTQG